MGFFSALENWRSGFLQQQHACMGDYISRHNIARFLSDIISASKQASALSLVFLGSRFTKSLTYNRNI
jgi:hypothetical protein